MPTKKSRGSNVAKASEREVRSGLPVATAPVGQCLVRFAPDEVGRKGVCAKTVRDVRAGEAVLIEAPLICTRFTSALFKERCKAFAKHVYDHLSDQPEKKRVQIATLWTQKAGFLREFAETPKKVKDKVLGLQCEFACNAAPIATSTELLAELLYEAELYSGKGDANDMDGFIAAGTTLSQQQIQAALACSVVNAFDFVPDGAEALFYSGSLFEHSCSPNVKMHIVLARTDMKPVNGASNVGAGVWIGEWRATQDIKENETVSASYFEDETLTLDFRERQQVLHRRMGFWCACVSCQTEKRNLKGSVQGLGQVQGPSGPAKDECGIASSVSRNDDHDAQHVPSDTIVPISWADLRFARLLRVIHSV